VTASPRNPATNALISLNADFETPNLAAVSSTLGGGGGRTSISKARDAIDGS